jgi:hypothetical protein
MEQKVAPRLGSRYADTVNVADMGSLIASDIGTVRSVDFNAQGI